MPWVDVASLTCEKVRKAGAKIPSHIVELKACKFSSVGQIQIIAKYQDKNIGNNIFVKKRTDIL